jgi:hypothetical protein
MPASTLAQSDPRRTGGWYLSGYWNEAYAVTAVDMRHGVLWLTCRWDNGRATTHCTPWDSRHDVIIAPPADHSCWHADVCACRGDDEHCECDAPHDSHVYAVDNSSDPGYATCAGIPARASN